MNSGNPKIVVSVSLPADLIQIIDELGSWQNRSKLITLALENYVRIKDPTIWKLLEMRREALKNA